LYLLIETMLTQSAASASGICATQIAKLAGLKVIGILDLEKSGQRMLRHGADLLIDRQDTARAASIIRGVTKGKLRFGLDAIGKETAGLLAGTLQENDKNGKKSHLVGLTGLPKVRPEGVTFHTVPIKSFHEAPEVGENLMIWLEKLLEHGLLSTPDIEIAPGGLHGINDALDRLRDGSVRGPRIVVPLSAGYV
jgi:D-arabinose 1-dehydrogenase-like Zn-dependent alcohol dehydrogenase